MSAGNLQWNKYQKLWVIPCTFEQWWLIPWRIFWSQKLQWCTEQSGILNWCTRHEVDQIIAFLDWNGKLCSKCILKHASRNKQCLLMVDWRILNWKASKIYFWRWELLSPSAVLMSTIIWQYREGGPWISVKCLYSAIYSAEMS